MGVTADDQFDLSVSIMLSECELIIEVYTLFLSHISEYLIFKGSFEIILTISLLLSFKFPMIRYFKGFQVICQQRPV